MKSLNRLMLALLSVLLLSIPFYRWGSGLILMAAFVPLLFIEDAVLRDKQEGRKGRLVWYCIIVFALFNILTTYWVKHAAWVGIIAAVIVNTTYMTLTFWLFHVTRRRLGNRLGYASLVVYWITFEFLYLRAQISFPWLLLGNAFSNDVMLIQWYEVTGVLGGTLWVLLMNIAIFRTIKKLRETRSLRATRPAISWVVGLFLVPALISLVRFMTYEEEPDPREIVIVQPNIDPYMKFIEMPQSEQTEHLIRIADSLTTPRTDYIVGPETFINNGLWENQVEMNSEVRAIREFLSRYPRARMVLGATTYRLYTDPSEYTPTSRPIQEGMYRFDSFNSALQLDSTGEIPIYHKSRLVVGVEHMPYARYLGFLEDLTVQLGGAFRSHGTQKFRETFVSHRDGTRVAPVICWESIFGEYVTDYVSDAGAHYLFVVTNDGWWKETPGHRQHNSFARLRAIETRRSIARSANTGISCFINQRGQETARLGWWKRSGLRGTLNRNDHITFYVKYGDYIGRAGLFMTVILLLYTLLARFIKK
ncbi:MAG TPA: apolipoprotein N-acyltransferase [Bacteroides sp.]|nr:apolipoprotein N-acyltransferase [Bacteroides sp.]